MESIFVFDIFCIDLNCKQGSFGIDTKWGNTWNKRPKRP